MSSAEFFSDENQKNIEILEENIQKDGLEVDDDWSPIDKPHVFQPDQKDEKDPKKEIISKEKSEMELLSYGIGVEYFKFCDMKYGGKYSVIIIVLLHIIINCCTLLLSLYLAYSLSDFGGNLDSDEEQISLSENEEFVKMLFIIIGSCFLSSIIGKYVSSLVFMSINKNIHQKVCKALLKTKMEFYDTNTSGRILNRLS